MAVIDSKESLDPRLRPKKSLPGSSAASGTNAKPNSKQASLPPITALTSPRSSSMPSNTTTPNPFYIPMGPRSTLERIPITTTTSTSAPAASAPSTSLPLFGMPSSNTSPLTASVNTGTGTGTHIPIHNTTEWSHSDYISLYRAIASCIPLDKHGAEITAAFNARSTTSRSHEDIMAHAADLQMRPAARSGPFRDVTPLQQQAGRGGAAAGAAAAERGERERSNSSSGGGGQKKEGAKEGGEALVVITKEGEHGGTDDNGGESSAGPPANITSGIAAAAAAGARSSSSPSGSASSASSPSGDKDTHKRSSPDGSQQQQQQQLGRGGAGAGAPGPSLILEASSKRLKIEVAPRKSKVFYQPGDGSVRIEFA